MATAFVFGNRGDADPGFVGARLDALGFEFVGFERDSPEQVDSAAAAAPDVVVVLGSEWSVYWPQVEREVAAEQAALRGWHERGVPILGICFGAQTLAVALGGSVGRAEPRGEIGWHAVESDDPLIDEGPWFQWHHDVFVPPPGAVELARSPVGPQAFAIGSTLAVQFHPEVNADIVARWAGGSPDDLDRYGLDSDALVEATQREQGRTRGTAAELVDRFLARVK